MPPVQSFLDISEVIVAELFTGPPFQSHKTTKVHFESPTNGLVLSVAATRRE